MKMTQRLSAAVLAASALLFAAGAQAADTGPAFQIAQDNWPVNSPINRSAPPTASSALPGIAGNTGSVAPLVVATSAPTTTTTQPNINITNTIPRTTPAAEPPRTQVEIRNQVPPAPVVNPPAAAPDIDIRMPDINIGAPATNNPPVTQKETVTRTDRFIYDDDDDPNDVDPNRNNILYMAIFGTLAVFLIGMIAIFYNRRRTTIIEDDI